MYDKKTVRLLVVDEQISFFDLLNEQAEVADVGADFSCAYTTSGLEALELIKSWAPSVVLLNAHLSEGFTPDLIERCCERHIQVIVTSDMVSASIEKSAKDWGADAFLVKSEDPDDLEHLIAEISARAPIITAQH